MSCNLITIDQGHKVARIINTRQEYLALRDSRAQQEYLQQARAGSDTAKRRLVQFNYSGHYPQGVVKGCKLPSMAFGFDLDDKESFERAAAQLLASPESYGLLMLERSARQGGHAVLKREAGRTILENQVRLATLLDCEMDTSAHDINRVYFTTSASPDDLLYLSDELFADAYDSEAVAREADVLEERERNGREEVPEGAHGANKHFRPTGVKSLEGVKGPAGVKDPEGVKLADQVDEHLNVSASEPLNAASYLGVPYSTYISKWWEMYNNGQEPMTSNRDVLTFELAVNFRHIMGFDRELMAREIPCYDGFPEAQKMKCIDSALAEKRTQLPKRLKDVLNAVRADCLRSQKTDPEADASGIHQLDQVLEEDELFYYNQLPQLPMGVSDSVDAVGHPMAMPALLAIAPAIGALATGIKLDVHECARGLNLCTFVVGDSASNKGKIDNVIAAWMHEVQDETDAYLQQEEEWAAKTVRIKSGKAPEQPVLPVRIIALNNTIRNIELRLARTQGKHAFSFTSEADHMVQAWRGENNFSVMLRQAYDEGRYDREAKSADATRVHIKHLRWNTVLCGTVDSLYRVITNYTDGLLNRVSIARTPDNTFTPLPLHPPKLTDQNAEHIAQVAHLLPLLQGTVVLNKLEDHAREWLESLRLEALMDHDVVYARQRMRSCVNAQRLTCALWLPFVIETLIKKHGMAGAEKRLREEPTLWIQMLTRMQNKQMMQLFDQIADYLVDNILYFFRTKITRANKDSVDSIGTNPNERSRRGKNDTIFERLADNFTFDDAYRQTLNVKGNDVSINMVRQMIKNWKGAKLIMTTNDGKLMKIEHVCVSGGHGH